jgi:hemimethylated DNA binding protein
MFITTSKLRCQNSRRGVLYTQAWLHKLSEAPFNGNISSIDPKAASVGRALYRESLRWCKENEMAMAPISNLIPVQIFSTPVIEESSLQRLYHGDEMELQKLLPVNSIVRNDRIFVSFESISEIRDFWRAIFRMNILPREGDVYRVRISAALSSMKALNALTKKINEIEKSRESHLDREGVTFRIGQVVQHMKDKWRGIIIGWEKVRITPKEERLTSLTSKQYWVDNDHVEERDENGIIWYKILPDFGDMSLSPEGTIRRYTNLRKGIDASSDLQVVLEQQIHLCLIDDVALCRVRNKETSLFFERFDSDIKEFVPKKSILYEYPLDYSHAKQLKDGDGNSIFRIGENISNAVQKIARRLELKILESQNRMIGGRSVLLDDFQVALSRLARGDVFSEFEILKTKRTPEQLATRHLNELFQFSTTMSEYLALRRCAVENKNLIQFNLGDIVQHKVFGFRGVVVGWDPKPVMDVSNWDGLFNIQSPNEKPFLHIRTDTRDCEEIFGSERPFRYVCQENLELCPCDRTLINPELDWKRDETEARYIAPDHIKVSQLPQKSTLYPVRVISALLVYPW